MMAVHSDADAAGAVERKHDETQRKTDTLHATKTTFTSLGDA